MTTSERLSIFFTIRFIICMMVSGAVTWLMIISYVLYRFLVFMTELCNFGL